MKQKYQVNDELPDGRIVTEVRPILWGADVMNWLYVINDDEKLTQTEVEEMYETET